MACLSVVLFAYICIYMYVGNYFFISEDTLVNVIANSMTRYYKFANARSTDYSQSDDTRLARAQANICAFQFRESGWLHWTKFPRRTHFRLRAYT